MRFVQPKYTQGCALLYDRPPQLDSARIIRALDPTQALGCRAHFVGGHDQGSLVVKGRIDLGEHHVDVVSVAAAADDQATRLALQESALSAEDCQALMDHRAYIHCQYIGERKAPLEQLRALYRVVLGLLDSCAPAEALGLVNVPALLAFTRAELLEMLRWLDADPPPIGLWLRVVALGGEPAGIWLVTRGLFAFMQPEIAVNGNHVVDEEGGESLLMSIASWLIQGGAVLRPDDTLEMLAEEDRESKTSHWHCRVPTSRQGFLAAPHGTLILEPAS